jgi:CMP-N,N'-diacetyllegionaminic acid synthase
MSTLAIIPARSGSVGVKGKNIRLLAGQPLISHAIEEARRSNIDRVILSTDSEEYADIGRRFGAEVPFIRPDHLAHSEAKAIDVVRHCIEYLRKESGWLPDNVFYMQPTSPFRNADRINEAIDLLDGNKQSSVISVVPVKEHPYYMFRPDGDGLMSEYVQMDNKPERRQDLPALYALNDNILLSKSEYLMRKDTSLVIDIKDFVPIEITEREALDINTEMDFSLAEFLMSY